MIVCALTLGGVVGCAYGALTRVLPAKQPAPLASPRVLNVMPLQSATGSAGDRVEVGATVLWWHPAPAAATMHDADTLTTPRKPPWWRRDKPRVHPVSTPPDCQGAHRAVAPEPPRRPHDDDDDDGAYDDDDADTDAASRGRRAEVAPKRPLRAEEVARLYPPPSDTSATLSRGASRVAPEGWLGRRREKAPKQEPAFKSVLP